jgi:hypothetical protein
MTALPYTDEATLADYYWQLSVHSINGTKALKNLNHWIETEQIKLDPPLQPHDRLCPRSFAYLVIETADGRVLPSTDFRVLIRAPEPVTVVTYPAPDLPPRFVWSTAEPPSVEQQGIKLLAEKLRRHQARGYTKRKDFYRKLLQRALKLSARKFDAIVWPGALREPGVKPFLGGAPTKKK